MGVSIVPPIDSFTVALCAGLVQTRLAFWEKSRV